MPQIKVGDDVLDIEDYEGVRIDMDMATKSHILVGLLALGYGLYTNNIDLIYFFGLVVVSFVVSIFLMSSIRVLVRRHGSWREIGKYKYSIATYLKKQLLAEMKHA